MLVSDEHPSNAQPPIDVTPLGILLVSSPATSLPVDVSIIHPDSFLKCVFSVVMLILLMGIFVNGLSLMLVTLLGIVMLVSDEHPLNAELPIDVTLSGIVMLVSDEHPLNAQ